MKYVVQYTLPYEHRRVSARIEADNSGRGHRQGPVIVLPR